MHLFNHHKLLNHALDLTVQDRPGEAFGQIENFIKSKERQLVFGHCRHVQAAIFMRDNLIAPQLASHKAQARIQRVRDKVSTARQSMGFKPAATSEQRVGMLQKSASESNLTALPPMPTRPATRVKGRLSRVSFSACSLHSARRPPSVCSDDLSALSVSSVVSFASSEMRELEEAPVQQAQMVQFKRAACRTIDVGPARFKTRRV